VQFGGSEKTYIPGIVGCGRVELGGQLCSLCESCFSTGWVNSPNPLTKHPFPHLTIKVASTQSSA
jgi:hypothetical protein